MTVSLVNAIDNKQDADCYCYYNNPGQPINNDEVLSDVTDNTFPGSVWQVNYPADINATGSGGASSVSDIENSTILGNPGSDALVGVKFESVLSAIVLSVSPGRQAAAWVDLDGTQHNRFKAGSSGTLRSTMKLKFVQDTARALEGDFLKVISGDSWLEAMNVGSGNWEINGRHYVTGLPQLYGPVTVTGVDVELVSNEPISNTDEFDMLAASYLTAQVSTQGGFGMPQGGESASINVESSVKAVIV